MPPTKIRMRIGQDEFEAEGDREVIDKYFEAFAEHVLTRQKITPSVPKAFTQSIEREIEVLNETRLPFAKIFQQDGRFISLIGRPSGENRELDVALLLLLGHKELKASESVSADELLFGLKQTGFNIERSDRLMARGEEKGLVTRSGIRRGTRYRLTNMGNTRANEVGSEIMDMFQIVP